MPFHDQKKEGLVQGINIGNLEGEKVGIDKGLIQGEAIGLDKGLEQGKLEEKIAMAKSMLADKMNIKIISKHTGLSKEEIEKLK